MKTKKIINKFPDQNESSDSKSDRIRDLMFNICKSIIEMQKLSFLVINYLDNNKHELVA